MTVKIIKNYIILLVVFFSWVSVASALEIKEVMYNPTVKTDHLWVKVCNNDSTGTTLTNWFIADQDIMTSSWHYHKINTNGSTVLVPSLCAIVAKATSNSIGDFKTKNPEISEFPLFYGNLTIGNEGNLGLSKDGKNIVEGSEMSYGGANTLLNTNSPTTSSEDNTVDETIDPIPLIKEDLAILKITTKIIPPKIITAGIPFTLSSLTTTNRGETYTVGNFVWNFGNGMVRKVGNSSPFEYIYEYPGEYALTLSYFDSTFSQIADATNRVTIKVIPSEIFISSVGTISDPYIEIENKSSSEIILSNWIVTAGNHYFTIPEGTTLLPNKKIKLSPKITGFVGGDIGSVVITDPNKEITATYPTETKKLAPRVSSTSLTTPYINPIQVDNSSPDDSLPQDSQVINLNDLGASAEESGSNIPKSIYPIIGLLVVIGIGVASFLLIKKKNSVEDYVEKGIRAEDMTIIE